MDTSSRSAPGVALATRALTAFLFLTGATGLVYQVVWTRYLSLLLGSSSMAVVVVLSAFMGGLAIGNWTFGRLADRPIRRLTLYGYLEIGIGLYCVFFPALFGLLSGRYLDLVARASLGAPSAFVAIRLAFAALLLLPPTILMGGTLPAATRFLVGLAPGVRRAVGRLYWINSLGAVVGAVAAGFFLVPRLGLDLSLDLAGLVNVAVGAGALLLRGRLGEDPHAELGVDEAEAPLPPRAVWTALAAVSLSGFAALVVEVAWTRLFALVLGGSTYAFSLMVATFILGIAIGSRLVAGARFGRGDPSAWLAGALAVVALALAASLPLYPRLPWIFFLARGVLAPTEAAFPVFQVLLFLMAGAVMLVPTIAMGATLPLAARIASHGPAVGTRVGLTWALNTIGTVLGALLAGLVLLPRLGLQRTFELVAAGYAVAALVALAGATRVRRPVAAALALAGVAALLGATLQPRWWLSNLTAGSYRLRGPTVDYQTWTNDISPPVLWNRDGASTTVTVTSSQRDRSLRVNGKPDASLKGDLDTQLLLGHLPALLGPVEPRRALVIGVGSGATVAALARHPGLQVTAVEIEAAVVEAARGWFKEVNDGVLSGHPRVEVLVEDAKTVFQRGGPPLDVIVSEPSNPWLAGIGGLFTVDFFEAARARLGPDGVMAQWLQVYEMDDATVRLVLRTFQSVFPEVTVWQAQPGDFVLLGSVRPLALDAQALAARMAVPAVAASLARIAVDSPEALLSRQAISPGGVAAAVGQGALNTDQFPVLEFEAPRGYFVGLSARVLADLDERPNMVGRTELLIHRLLGGAPKPAQLLSMARSLKRSQVALTEALLRVAARQDPASPAPIQLALLLEEQGRHQEAWRQLQVAPRTPEVDRLLARTAFAAAVEACQGRRNGLSGRLDCGEAVGLGEKLLVAGRTPAELLTIRELLARAYLWQGDARPALEIYQALVAAPGGADEEKRASWHTGEAAALLTLGDRAGAQRASEAALALDSRVVAARRILAATAR